MRKAIPLLIVMMASCSLFEPRTPENPDPDPGYQWQDPTHPSIVVSNLQNSLTGLSVNHYMACFHENFVFLADPIDVSDPAFGSLDFSGWTRDVELQTVSNIIYVAQASGYPEDSLSVAYFMINPEKPSDPPVPNDSVTIWRDYSIVAAGTLGSGWDRSSQGTAEITMLEDDFGLWSIVRWQDERIAGYTGSHYTWGVAKALYR